MNYIDRISRLEDIVKALVFRIEEMQAWRIENSPKSTHEIIVSTNQLKEAQTTAQQQFDKLSAKYDEQLKKVDELKAQLAILSEAYEIQVRENAELKAQLSAVSPTGWRSITERPPPNRFVVVMSIEATAYPFLAHTRPDGSWAILHPGESWREAKFDEYDSSYKWMDIPQ